MVFKMQRATLLHQFSLTPIKQQMSFCCHIFLTVFPSYHSKVTPIDVLHAEKLEGVGPVDKRPSNNKLNHFV